MFVIEGLKQCPVTDMRRESKAFSAKRVPLPTGEVAADQADGEGMKSDQATAQTLKAAASPLSHQSADW